MCVDVAMTLYHHIWKSKAQASRFYFAHFSIYNSKLQSIDSSQWREHFLHSSKVKSNVKLQFFISLQNHYESIKWDLYLHRVCHAKSSISLFSMSIYILQRTSAPPKYLYPHWGIEEGLCFVYKHWEQRCGTFGMMRPVRSLCVMTILNCKITRSILNRLFFDYFFVRWLRVGAHVFLHFFLSIATLFWFSNHFLDVVYLLLLFVFNRWKTHTL